MAFSDTQLIDISTNETREISIKITFESNSDKNRFLSLFDSKVTGTSLQQVFKNLRWIANRRIETQTD